MHIYFALIIPLLAGLFLVFYYKHKIVWFEPVITIGTCLLFIFIFIFKLSVETALTTDIEYWGSLTEKVEYYEAWNERIHRTCTRSCGKNCTTTYDCSYTRYHSEYWQIVTTSGRSVRISQSEYNRIKTMFGNSNFVDLNRHYYTNDGDKYVSTWDGTQDKAEPVTTEHSYENRIQASSSVFNYQEVTPEEKEMYKLYDYPEIKKGHILLPVIGDKYPWVDKYLDYHNGRSGKKKELRIWILIFKDQPIEAAYKQEAYWIGGNKNEFIVTIGLKGDKPTWCHAFSWSEIEEPKIRIRNMVMKQKKLDLMAISKFMVDDLEKNFERKHFKDFSYLTVNPPFWAVLTTYLVTLMITIGLSIWSVKNDIDHDSQKYGRKRYRY